MEPVIEAGHEDSALALIRAGVDGSQHLELASGLGQSRVVGELLETGEDFDLEDALHSAAGTGSVECIRLLLRAAADVDAFVQVGSTCHINNDRRLLDLLSSRCRKSA